MITEISINDSATAYQNTSTTVVSDFKQPIDTTETQDIENGEGGGRSNTEEFHSTRKHVTPHNYFKIRHRHRWVFKETYKFLHLTNSDIR